MRFDDISDVLQKTVVTVKAGAVLNSTAGCEYLRQLCIETAVNYGKIMIIGNGGSAATASHLANDFSLHELRAITFNDAAALTCIGNDHGYDSVFADQIARHANVGDVLLAISSSGRSQNILEGARAMKKYGRVITFSGFSPSNPLRRIGQVNFWVPSAEYGLVEIAHLALGQAVADDFGRAQRGKGRRVE